MQAEEKCKLIYKGRMLFGASTDEAAQLVRVSKRTWELWESGKREIPDAALELFVQKITKGSPPINLTAEMTIVNADDGFAVLDVVSSENFLNLIEKPDGTATISSMAVTKKGRQYIHRTVFKVSPYNEHVIQFAARHKVRWDA